VLCDAIWARGFIRYKSLHLIHYFFLMNGRFKLWSIGWVGLAILWAILVLDYWMERAVFSLYGDSLWRNIWWPKAY